MAPGAEAAFGDGEGAEEPEEGAPVRLGGLRGAAHLNGEVGLVQRRVPETGRYEVMLKGGDVKAVQLANLVPLKLLEEVSHWCDKLAQPGLQVAGIRPALARLGRLPVTVEVLQQTGVGKIVNQLAKRADGPQDVAAHGRALVQQWRKMFQRSQAARQAASDAPGGAPAAPTVPTPSAPAQSAGGSTPSRAPPPASPAAGGAGAAPAQPSRPAAPFAGYPATTPTSSRAGGCAARAGGGGASSSSSRAGATTVGRRAADFVDSDGEIEVPAPPQTVEEARRLVTGMKDARFDEARMGYLRSLRGASSAVQWAAVQAGLLSLLDAWMRAHAPCRADCLALLARLPLTHAALIEAHLPGTVWSCKSRRDVDPEIKRQAGLLLETWRARGVLPEKTPLSNGRPAPTPTAPAAPTPGSANEWAPTVQRRQASPEPPPEPKRPRIRPPAEGERQPSPPASAPVQQPPAPAQPAQPPLPKNLPPALKGVDERIARVLLERPEILEFLQKHPSVMQNLSAKSVAFLRRNLNKSKVEDGLSGEEADEREGQMIIVSDLHPQATEADIVDLLEQAGLGPAEVTLPRESRKQRSCRVAFAVLPSREAANEAIQRLQGRAVRGGRIRLELADSAAVTEHGAGPETTNANSERRIRWPASEELWQFAMFDRQESVAQFRERLNSADFSAAARLVPEPSHARFQEAARREHAEEARLVREALGGQS